jgi:flagellar biogenesis protein FliO
MTTWQTISGFWRQSAPETPSDRVIPFENLQRASQRANRGAAFSELVRPLPGQLMSAYKWLEKKGMQQLGNKRLRVTETVSLGEKRTVSILKIDGTEILIGSAAGQVSLLAVLDPKQGEWRKELTPMEHSS